MEFFNPVEVFQLLPVKYDVVGAFELGDPVNRKARRLIETDEQVEDQKRKNHTVDDRAGD